MVDTTKAGESDFVTAELVNSSPTKICVPLGAGNYEDVQFNPNSPPVSRLSIPVEIDGKKKIWRPNKGSVQNLWVYGKDSSSWVGKRIFLRVMKLGGRDQVVGLPADSMPTMQKIADEKIPSYARGPGVEYSKGSPMAPPGYDDGGSF